MSALCRPSIGQPGGPESAWIRSTAMRTHAVIVSCVVLGLSSLSALPVLPARAQGDEVLEQALRDRELDPLRKPDRAETFAVDDLSRKYGEARRPESFATDLPGNFAVRPEPTPVAPELAREIAQLLLAPASYSSLAECAFQPGVAIRFHRGDRAVDAFVCFGCSQLAFQRVGSARSFREFGFKPVEPRLLELLMRARPADERLAFVKKMMGERDQRQTQTLAREDRWRAAMPASLQPFFVEMMQSSELELEPLQAALAREIPDKNARIRSLLQLFGSDDGSWAMSESYEIAVEHLLAAYSTPDLIAAAQAGPLSSEQTLGTARIFSALEFHDRANDRELLPADLRAALLERGLASADSLNRGRAQEAFGIPASPPPD